MLLVLPGIEVATGHWFFHISMTDVTLLGSGECADPRGFFVAEIESTLGRDRTLNPWRCT